MSYYRPPVSDMRFALCDVLGFVHDDLDLDTIEAVLDEAAKLATDVLAPLNVIGDEQGAKLDGDIVTTAAGFADAYKQYCAGGWNAVPFDPQYGGQGLPWAIAFPIQEMWQGANMSFGLCPLLNQGAVEAISVHGTQAQKDEYLEKLISGEWTGTMNLTEPQAGSDLGLIRSKASLKKDDTYRISGQKIYITYGEHDMADNIIHLVLARIDGAPDDVKGISLFIVPKILRDGTRNAVKCIGLEHKLGIHASPTCTMDFDRATGYLIGEENAGLKCMFTMMNNARLSVGLQGVAIAEASYQHALAYANDREQGKSYETGKRVVIADHADVRRMLLTMKSQTQGGRYMAYAAAQALDAAHAGDANARAMVDVLTPIVKSWCTDMAVDVTSIGVQIHGGMGFVEETGAAQFMRDARILPIYEGTNGIQALDLVFRKIARDGGAGVTAFLDNITETIPADANNVLLPYIENLRGVIKTLVSTAAKKTPDALNACEFSGAPLLKGFGVVLAGVYLACAANKAMGNDDAAFAADKREVADFYLAHILPLAHGHLQSAAHSLAAAL